MFLTHIIYFSLGTKRITFIILFVCVGVELDSHNIHALYGKEQHGHSYKMIILNKNKKLLH